MTATEELDGLSPGLWPLFVEKVQDVIRTGLERLAADAHENSFGGWCENDLNRELFFRMRRVAAERHRALLSLSPRPALGREHTWNLVSTAEANNQPSPDDTERTPRENKRPDFQWSFQDDEAEDIDRSTRTYVVECKRLGRAIGGWAFNDNYIAHGIRRYVDSSHLYGKDDVSGGMIGYVQSMNVETIWAEIDHQLGGAGLAVLPRPALIAGSSVVHLTSHGLSRVGAVSPFQLHHIWVDLRPA